MCHNMIPESHKNAPKAMDVLEFVRRYRKKLKPNQIELLEHFSEYIFGFKFYSLEQNSTTRFTEIHKAEFIFRHDGVEGHIKIQF